MDDGRGRFRGRTPAEPVRRPGESPPLQGAWAARAARPAETEGRPGAMEAVARLERANPTGGVAAGRGRGRGRRNEPDMRVTTLPHPGFVKLGRDGTEVKLASNYFEITSAPDIMMYQYHVDYIPVLDDTRLQKALLREHENTIGKYIFTGTELFTPTRLKQPYELTSLRRSDNAPIRMTIRLIKEVHPDDEMYVQIMNIIMRRCLEMLDLVEIRRDFFDKVAAKRVNTSQREKLEIWPGYLTTIKWHQSKLLFNVDFLNKIIRIDTVAEEFNLARQGRQFDQNGLKAKLIGKIVMTKYNDRTYRIDDIDFDKTAMSTFHLRKENRDVSYKEYYDMRYKIKIQFGDLPLLVSRPTKRDRNRGDTQMVYLLPECCVVTGITDDMRKNMHLMRDITSTTRAGPGERVDSLMRFMNRIKGKENILKELKYWGLSFSNHLVTVENGRRLAQQTIIQGNSASYPVNAHKNDWSQQCRDKIMAKLDKKLQSWFVVCPNRLKREIENFVNEIIQTGTPMGFVINHPYIKLIDNDRIEAYTRAIDDEFSSKNYDLVMVVLTSKNNSTDKYSAIKNRTCVKLGIPCQVITRELITQQQTQRIKSCATKVMIQIAAKIGCEPWQLALPKTNWMVCGYDTYHDKSQRTAVGAFVASTNDTFTRYMSAVEVHENNEEISIKFKMFVLKALQQYRKHNNNALPQKIFIYRDGIGTGDIQRVKSIEVDEAKAAIRDAAKFMDVSYNPGLAYIIVSKRINTRFFEKSGQNYNNPPAGVVVDNTVTLKERFDFFLVSQSVNQGTVSPTSYHVIEDTGKTHPDIHQRLAYGLTHLYYNWAGTLSVPAPCQYAHKLAYLVGEYRIEGKIQDNLEHLPYYL